jgi:hypothetical protein
MKSFYHEFNLEAFWGSLASLPKLQVGPDSSISLLRKTQSSLNPVIICLWLLSIFECPDPQSDFFLCLSLGSQSLKIQGWSLQAADVQGLESLTNLRHLHIKRSTNHPTGLHGLSLLSDLKYV